MNKSRFVARGGMLTALSVVLLYLACVLPVVRIGLCAAGGIIPAIPMAKRHVKLALTVYFATAVLSAVILPQKSVALLYILVFGLYTLTKYAIEGRIRGRARQWICKTLFAATDGALLWGLLQMGLVSLTGPMVGIVVIGWYRIALIASVVLGWFAVFAVYDIAFSQLIAQLRRIFPED